MVICFPSSFFILWLILKSRWKLELFQDRDTLKVNTIFKSLTDEDFNRDGSLSNTFQLAHAGAVLHCLSKDGIVTFITRIFEMLKSHGTFIGYTIGADPPEDWVKGRYLHSVSSLKQLMEEIGFIDVKVASVDPGRAVADPTPGVNQIFLVFKGKKL